MKIVFVTSRYPTENNPYNHMFVHMRCVEFLKMGHDVQVYVPSGDNTKYVYEGVAVEKIAAKDIAKKLDERSIIYIHLLNITPIPHLNGWYIYKHILQKKLPYIMYVHGNEVQKHSAREFDITKGFIDFLKRLKKDFYAMPRMESFVRKTKDLQGSRYVFPSLWMKGEMERNLDIKLDNYHIIPNGIDTDLFEFHSNFSKAKKFITIRPLSSKKYAVDIAIKLMGHLPEDCTLDIYGKGEFQDEYEALIKSLGLEKRVKILNTFIERKNLNATLSNYGVFLSPTRMDAQGVMMCEAMASGLLTISSDNTAIPEFIVDEQNGILIDNVNYSNCEKIIKVLSSKEIYDEIALAARESMVLINLKNTADLELNILEKKS